MLIKGLQKLTLLDFPGHLAATVFTGGCDLRCPFCHNSSLVLVPGDLPTFSEADFFMFLESRRGKLEGVAVTGGEPMLNPDLPEFLSEIKKRGFLVKLDTNGTHPDLLTRILREGLADYVAMDIKNSPDAYPETVGREDVPMDAVRRSAALLMESGTEYEFRTTLVREFHTPERIRGAGEWIAGAERWFLQMFTDSGAIISPGLHAPTEEEARAYLSIARAYVPAAELRGI